MKLEASGFPLVVAFPELGTSVLVVPCYLSGLDITGNCSLPSCYNPYPQFLDKRENHILWALCEVFQVQVSNRL